MNKKGFTLIELLGIVIIISMLVIIALPLITNSVNNYSKKTDKLTLSMIKEAAKLYIDDNKNEFVKNSENSYCITINELVEKEYLKDSIEYQGMDITNTKSLQVTYTNSYNLELVDNENCIDYRNICKLLSGEVNEIGSKYQCKVKEKMQQKFENGYYFYVLSHNNDGTTNLIMDRNMYYDSINDLGEVATSINTGNVAWYSSNTNAFGPVEAMKYLHSVTKDWNNIPNIIMNYTDEENSEFKTSGYNGIKTTLNKTIITTKDGTETLKIENLKARLPKKSEVNNYDSENKSNAYLYDYLNLSNNIQINPITGINGYWLLSSYPGISNVSCIVHYDGTIAKGISMYKASGVRPVITLPSTYLTIQSN